MSKIFYKPLLAVAMVFVLARPALAVVTTKTLSGHVPAVVSRLSPAGELPANTNLHLAIGLPLHNQNQLQTLLQQVADPASTNYRHYLTPEEFTARFGPTEQDSQAVIQFAEANGLHVKQVHKNRMLIEVDGRASDVAQAFQVAFHTYHHPSENRDFYAPDTEPKVPSTLPVLDIQGLNTYAQAHPRLRHNTITTAAKSGSGPFGTYLGNDFRPAYVPGTSLDGSGQKVALFEYDGYLANDIAVYEQRSGLPPVSLTNVLLQGFSGFPDPRVGGQIEVTLDIDMVIAMAPGVSQILVYEGNFQVGYLPNLVLSQIANDNSARQISCSWGWMGGPSATTDQIFQQMIIQGQTFFDASGDVCAFLPAGPSGSAPGSVDDPNAFNAPSDDPYITQVGGTTLSTTGPGGTYASETVWNWAVEFPGQGLDGIGSSGGISGYYPIPAWQQGISMASNGGSTTMRNLPDVAMTADNIDIIINGSDFAGVGGTSCAAPLWAGFIALVNQKAALAGRPPVGFINPAIYALAKTPAYASCFHDVTSGNNTWSQSPTNFYAVSGFDLGTGLGSPNGTNLINALATSGNGITGGLIISAPRGPYGSTLSVMNGSNPNGDWLLFVQDDAALDVGIITNGWMVTLTTANPVGFWSDNQIYVSATNAAIGFATNYSLTLAVTNYGPSISSNVLVSDVLPGSGLSLVSSNHTAGTVAVFGSTLAWNVGTLQTNAGATLTLMLHAGAGGSYTNSATVSSLTTDPNPDDNNVSSSVTVTAPPAPPVISSPVFAGPNSFQLTVTGNPGYPTVVQASTNLVNWVSLYTNTPTFIFTNLITTNYPVRFYRAVIGL
jgi:uncharacterized repeat protein (TIGR01451 family)